MNVRNLSGDTFLKILRETLSAQEGREKTADSIVSSVETVGSDLFITDDERRMLCQAVLSVFADVTKRERKFELARICTKFGLRNVIIDGNYTETLSENDVEIIERHTGHF